MKKWVSIALLAVVATMILGMQGCNGEEGAPTNVNISIVNDNEGNPGGGIHVTWSAPTEGTPDEYVVYVDGVAQVAVETLEDYVYTPCAEIQVAAVYGSTEKTASPIDIGAVASTVSVWSVSDPDPNHQSAFGFGSGGSATAYAITGGLHNNDIDFYITSDIRIASGSDHIPPLNTKENSASEETGTFDALGIVSPTGQNLYFTNLSLTNGGIYGLWLDPNANGYDASDNFIKAQVTGIDVATEKVDFKFAYQTEAGLRFVVE
ncbi:hypothetical protein JXM67_09500 [candidate division WOR-3 bacterium]|nr:hypothetical protein [candidate division WOR-3 bacterium]